MIGKTLAHYKVLDKIGSGGMGAVYRAEDRNLGRHVALKLLSEEMAGTPDRLERFRREAQAVAALNHPNIVTIYSIDESPEGHFITMELVEGKGHLHAGRDPLRDGHRRAPGDTYRWGGGKRPSLTQRRPSS